MLRALKLLAYIAGFVLALAIMAAIITASVLCGGAHNPVC